MVAGRHFRRPLCWLVWFALAAAPCLAQQETVSLEGRIIRQIGEGRMTAVRWSEPVAATQLIDVLTGDFNCDKVSDMAVVEQHSGSVFVALSDSSSRFTTTRWAQLAPGTLWLDISVGDFDGDGCSDIFRRKKETFELYVLISNGKDGFADARWGQVAGTHPWSYTTVADCNGDGKDDVLLWEAKGGQWWLMRSDGRSFAAHYWSHMPKERSWADVHAADFNQDGKDDLLVRAVKEGELLVFFSAEEEQPAPLRPWGIFSPIVVWEDAHVADLNGDGYPDFLAREARLDVWWSALNKQGQESENVAWSGFQPEGEIQSLAGDVNGDERDDILVFNVRSGEVWALLSSALAAEISERRLWGTFPPGQRWVDVRGDDFNGDGLLDVLAQSDKTREWFVGLSPAVEPAVDVTVKLNGKAAAKSDRQGRFFLRDLPRGSYTVEPERAGSVFLPPAVTAAASAASLVFVMKEESELLLEPGHICLGYDPRSEQFGRIAGDCPAGYAFYAVDDMEPVSEGKGNRIFIEGACCRLPRDDILTDTHGYFLYECPDGFVATGSDGKRNCRRCSKSLRCTKVNNKRYQLGPSRPGVYWGLRHPKGFEATWMAREKIPLAIRHAVGRLSEKEWDDGGCIGYPWGSLLVRKEEGGCAGLYFRELQYRGLAGDPLQGTPVQMFPECDALTSAFDPKAICITQ